MVRAFKEGSENMFESLDRSRLGKMHLWIIVLASMGLFLDGYDLSIIGSAQEYVLFKAFSETKLVYDLINASSFIGMAVGAPILGILSDRKGRKFVFTLDLIFFVVFAATAAFSQNSIELFASRLLLGVGIGGDYPASSTLISEFSPIKKRGTILMLMVAFYWIGAGVASALTLPTLYFFGTNFWRALSLIGAIAAVPIILMRIRIPESARWLEAHGDDKDAREVIKEVAVPESAGIWKEETPFYRRQSFVLSLVFVLSAWFLFDVASYGIGFYYPLIYGTIIGSPGETVISKIYGSALFGLLLTAGALIGYAIAIYLVDRAGRAPLTIVGFGGMSVILGVLAFTRITGLAVLGYFFIFVLFEQWIGAVTLFYPTELFKTKERASLQGTATLVSRIGAVTGIFVFPLYAIFSSLTVFFLFSFIGFVIALLLAPETKKRSLEEISGDRY